MNKHRKTSIKLDELNVRGSELLFEQLSLRVNTTLNATMILFLSFLSLIFPSSLSGRSFTLYSFFLHYPDCTLVHHPSPHLSICPINHLLWLSVNGGGWNYIVQRSSPHKCGQRSCCSAFKMRWQQPLPQDISVFLLSLHVPEVYPYRWIFLKGHPDCLNICLTDILCIRGV